ncbi:hypothetical protein B1T45_00545 [Mycobacterium kansasii]|nr:hypothetical protein B1T43_00520 [Mycobacterium kansasii]ARG60046.1 hypothetical protein B1T45_00545 [Mycobacterium kansasii]ARG77704.1 hypothetical protein B1T51_28185 [Mycobacterium kansasii]ARG95282.1 hypothetical protein B1T50_28775 [Mycobacterium kansasii]KZS73640.1 hypothetical protein A4G30_27215 [Mycobacterium kansasii]
MPGKSVRLSYLLSYARALYDNYAWRGSNHMTIADATPALPRGAEYASPFDEGTRCVFSDRHRSPGGDVCASAVQTRSGAICDDPFDEGPRVHVSVHTEPMTPAQARQLARHLITAAEQADAWRREAATSR